MKTIGIFKNNCPGGWTRMVAWDGKYLMGANGDVGTSGGTDTHKHSVTFPNQINFSETGSAEHPGNHNYGPEYLSHFTHQHYLAPDPANTSEESSLPETMDVVFCYKED